MKDSQKKRRVAFLFGGPSAEHEISVITALQAMAALDPCQYDAFPVYIHPNGQWFTGKPLFYKTSYPAFASDVSRVPAGVCEVTLLPKPGTEGLSVLDHGQLIGTIPVDVYFLAFHGQKGEDGCIQGLLELAGATYTGCSVLQSAIAMNKAYCKTLLKGYGIPALPHCLVSRADTRLSLRDVREQILATAGLNTFPLFVKPCHLGSSIGIAKAEDLATLDAALANVFEHDSHAIVEPCLSELLEINVAVIDDDPPRASVVEIPVASDGALSYEDKYLRGGSKGTSNGMAALTRMIDPQDLDERMKNDVITYAIDAFKALDLRSVVRFDFMVDLKDNKIYFNELNPIPGSLAFYLWEKSLPPLLYTDVLDHLIKRAIVQRKRHNSSKLTPLLKALR